MFTYKTYGDVSFERYLTQAHRVEHTVQMIHLNRFHMVSPTQAGICPRVGKTEIVPYNIHKTQPIALVFGKEEVFHCIS